MSLRLPRRLAALVLSAVAALLVAASAAPARVVSAPVARAHTFVLPAGTTHLAVYWLGARHAAVSVRLRRARGAFGRPAAVQLDELAEGRRSARTFGTIMRAGQARWVRVTTDRPLRRVWVLALHDHGPAHPRPTANAASISQPPVILRAGWGADESLRFDSTGKEIWPPAFYPVQKLIVHHTATQNNDPDPAATIRSIYYYHAVTQGWGDIGYNFLIDEAGHVYEGRHSFDPPSASPPGEDSRGYGVTGAHAVGYNSGTVGIALLGTLSTQDATPAARSALEQLLAWEADQHGIDPQGSSLYTNPVNGTQATFPNIAGHRDVGSTECPGGAFYASLPTVRSDVAAMLAGSSSSPPPATTAPAVSTGKPTAVGRTSAVFNGSVNPNGSATTWWFQYGRTTSYGTTTASSAAGSGTTAVPVSASVSGLSRSTTYHFRLVAQNAVGAVYGADQSFRTGK